MTAEQERIPTVGPRERFTPDTLAKLDAPLNAGRVAKDFDGNPYLEGWDVIAAANAYFGFDGWASDVLHVGIAYSIPWEVGSGQKRRQVDVAVYQARVAIEAGGVRKVDIGSSITADDSPRSHETAAKGAVTDALKRAMRQFGAQFGNDLYDKGRTGVYEEPREPQRTPPIAPAARPELADGPGMKNSGDFLMRCNKELGLHRDEVLKLHNVTRGEQLNDVVATADITWEELFETTKRMQKGVLA